MLDVNFVQVVERRGFTAAGRALRMPKSTLSYRMKKLEAELRVRTSRAPELCPARAEASVGPNSGCVSGFGDYGAPV
jgi:Bacterial regulatory helix-turn-helix protein, lysR family